MWYKLHNLKGVKLSDIESIGTQYFKQPLCLQMSAKPEKGGAVGSRGSQTRPKKDFFFTLSPSSEGI